MFRFTASTEGNNKLGLREALQAYADGYGVPAHVTADHAAETVLGISNTKSAKSLKCWNCGAKL